MNGTPDKISELFQLLPQGAFTNEDELRGYVKDETTLKEVYGLVPKEYFKDESEYLGYFGDSIKKKASPIELASEGQTVLQELGQPLNEPLTPPLQLESDKPKDRETTVIGDLLRSLKGSSLRTAGSILAVPQMLNRTLTGSIVRPLVKSMGGSDEEAEYALNSITSSTPQGTAILGLAEAQKPLSKLAQKTEDKMAKIEGNIYENLFKGKDGETDLGAALELFGRGSIASVPYLAITAATAGGGTLATLGAVGATATAQQYLENEGMAENKKILNAWMYGGAEALGELVSA